jgi:hypothetical protein
MANNRNNQNGFVRLGSGFEILIQVQADGDAEASVSDIVVRLLISSTEDVIGTEQFVLIVFVLLGSCSSTAAARRGLHSFGLLGRTIALIGSTVAVVVVVVGNSPPVVGACTMLLFYFAVSFLP